MRGRTPEKIVTVQRTRISVTTIYPNLLTAITDHGMTVADLGAIIGVSDQAMRRRLLGKANGGTDITAYECHLLCEHFHKSFEWLFATGDVA
jgi:DNA-binding XRE family transcriptional regulator